MRSPAVKKSNAKWLKIIGAVLAVCGLAACWSPIDMMIWLGNVEIWYIEELLWALAITAAGVAMLCSGVSIDRSLKRYNKYLAVVGRYEAMAVEQLARTLGYPRDRVEKDLQKMIDKGYFGDEAYLNMELGYLFRSGQADAELKQKRQQEQAQAAAALRRPRRRRRAIPASCGGSAGPMTPLRTRSSPPRSTGWRPSPPRSSGRWRRTPRSGTGSTPS